METLKWEFEFEGPAEFMKTLARSSRSREIPKNGDSKAPQDVLSQDTNTVSKGTTSESSNGEKERQNNGQSRDDGSQNGVQRPTVTFQDAKPPQPAGTATGTAPLKVPRPPPPPGPRPPPPPGPRPPAASSDFRKAAPLPESLKRAPLPPTSVSAFKNPPHFAHGASEDSPSAAPAPSALAVERPKPLKRPRGMSLSSNARRTFDSYERLGQVGTGTYGEVFRARDKETGEVVALKKVRLDGEQEGFPVTALREIKNLRMLNHPNIVQLKEVVTSRASDATRNKGSVYIVFEYCECDLVGLMKTSRLNESHIMCMLLQLLEAVHMTHKGRFLHRDIKPSNILVNSQGILKLADWGLSRRYIEGGKHTNRVVTLWYRAPELLLGEQQYSTAVDMWAVGCVMAELLLGRQLFPGTDEAHQLKLIFETCGKPSMEQMPPGWKDLPLAGQLLNSESIPSTMLQRFAPLRPVARDLLCRLLELDPAKRISAQEALNHEYFWSDPRPSKPEQIPVPKGVGVHELQIREEHARKHESSAHPRPSGMASRN